MSVRRRLHQCAVAADYAIGGDAPRAGASGTTIKRRNQ
jgi:hypothetical protein